MKRHNFCKEDLMDIYVYVLVNGFNIEVANHSNAYVYNANHIIKSIVIKRWK